MEMPPLELPDFDVMFGEEEPEPSSQAFVTFDDDNLISEEQTETDVRNMEGHFRMTLQQMKEHVLCSVRTHRLSSLAEPPRWPNG